MHRAESGEGDGMTSGQLRELLNRYFDGGLDREDLEELETELRRSREARQIYWEVAEVHGMLSEVCGEERGGMDRVILDGVSEQPSNFFRRRAVVMMGVAASLALLFALWWQGETVSPVQEVVVATMEDGRGAMTFMEAGIFEVGASKSVELVFRGGARVAIEGAARLELISEDRMRLLKGRIGVEVPKGAEGFTVDTPDGRVVDFGTRFGLEVGEFGVARAEVFDGRIDVVLGEETHRMEGRASLWLDEKRRGAVVSGADERAFPMPRSDLGWPVAGGFNGGKGFGAGKPEKVDVWSGDHCELRTASAGIQPKSGSGMLQFVATHSKGDVSASNVAGEIWRVVDLEEVSRKMGRRPERVTLSGWFNRVRGGSDTDSRFIMGMWEANAGGARFEWDRSGRQTSVLTDGDPESWERADLEMIVPPDLRYLVLMLGAFENVRNEEEVGKVELDGHFVDEIQLRFFADRQSSTRSRYWRGGEGNWEVEGKWSENVLPSGNEDAVIQGGHAVISGHVVLPETSLIVARDSDHQGRLTIEESGRLELGSREFLLGYNPGSEAEVILKGEVHSQGEVMIGRNNRRTLLRIDGGLLETTRRVTLSQYDSEVETSSELVISEGGRLKAGSLRLINDEATLRLENGLIEVESLELGRGAARAMIIQTGGVVRASELKVDGGFYQLQAGALELKGKWTAADWEDAFGTSAEGLSFESRPDGGTLISR
ncbi:MAG: FecR family protein [Akkermansiaceae bacterium]